MRIRETLGVIRSRWVIVVTFALIGLLVAAFSAVRAPRIYRAESSVFFSVSVGSATRDLSRGFSYVQGVVGSYAQVANQPVVLNPVIEKLGLDTTAKRLSASVSAEVPIDTVMVEIDVASVSPQRAKAVADAVAAQLATTVNSLVPDGAAKQTNPIKVTTVSPATVPTAPASPRMAFDLTSGLLAGGVLGVLLALARDFFDARVRGRRDVQRLTDLPVIGTVVLPAGPAMRGRMSGRRARQRSEEYGKELRTNFQHLRHQRRLRSVVFTSAKDERVTTATVVALGMELAQTGVSTVLVDADLRRPSLSAWFSLQGALGVSSVLKGNVGWREAVQDRGQLPLYVLPAGPPMTESWIMDPDIVSRMIVELSEIYDVVLIKVPPVLVVADGLLYSRLADGCFLVTDGAAMNRDELTDELHALNLANAFVLGVVTTA